ncbi:hypothetical protein [Lacrimispora defluvii]|uniref:Class 3 adenylate cyclase n=1 Tax=Lacrimispora defluvii TaxID=2719233 RepID=A0ABX1VZ14_9FIRM|nr:hypothetical protein [Lacrimispora defluvii]NNJ32660.1 hypothetical protein [Lacrimispora defluvii]
MEIAYENRVVAFIDILGFKNHINATACDLKYRAKIFSIMNYLKMIEEENYKGTYSLSDLGKEVSVFSDSVVISYPLNYRGGVPGIMLDIVYLQNTLLNEGILTRGGISIGDIIHKGNIVFGPAMIQAYTYESTCAKYPRVYVGGEVIQFGYNNPAPQNSKEYEMNFINRLLRIDPVDKIVFIDYLNQMEEFDEGRYEVFKENVDQTIRNGIQDLRPDVREKYEWLKTYFTYVFGLNKPAPN